MVEYRRIPSDIWLGSLIRSRRMCVGNQSAFEDQFGALPLLVGNHGDYTGGLARPFAGLIVGRSIVAYSSTRLKPRLKLPGCPMRT
jgi:hypothetical protein